MIRIGPLGVAGRTRGIENGGEIVGADLPQHGHGGVARRPYGSEAFRRDAVLEHDDLRTVFDAFEPLGALRIGQHQLAIAQADPVGHFLAGPPAVEQRRAAARHDHAHIGDDPIGRIARGDTHAVALFDPVLACQAMRHMAGGMPDFAEGQPHVAIDDEQLVLLLVAEMREEMRQAGRRVLERRHGDAAARRFGQFEHLSRCGNRLGDPADILVELCRHGWCSVLSKSARGPVIEARAVIAARRRLSPKPLLCQKPPRWVAGCGLRLTSKGITTCCHYWLHRARQSRSTGKIWGCGPICSRSAGSSCGSTRSPTCSASCSPIGTCRR